jgi:hypothetical protein
MPRCGSTYAGRRRLPEVNWYWSQSIALALVRMVKCGTIMTNHKQAAINTNRRAQTAGRRARREGSDSAAPASSARSRDSHRCAHKCVQDDETLDETTEHMIFKCKGVQRPLDSRRSGRLHEAEDRSAEGRPARCCNSACSGRRSLPWPLDSRWSGRLHEAEDRSTDGGPARVATVPAPAEGRSTCALPWPGWLYI